VVVPFHNVLILSFTSVSASCASQTCHLSGIHSLFVDYVIGQELYIIEVALRRASSTKLFSCEFPEWFELKTSNGDDVTETLA
jgi:hypothetical protein